jgi:zinc D-Ala-D-Ala dipeptidase
MLKPIPILKDIDGFEKVQINECGEELIELLSNDKIFLLNIYRTNYLQGTNEKIYLRKKLVVMLYNASISLPQNVKLGILDGYRTLELQNSLYNSFFDKIKLENPSLDKKSIELITLKYCSRGIVNYSNPSPHSTGGAVDVCLLNEFNEMLFMGSDFDENNIISSTTYFENFNDEMLLPLEREAKFNRRLLFHCMTNAGFTNYFNEWWHFDYGNQVWGKIKNNIAIYGMKLF